MNAKVEQGNYDQSITMKIFLAIIGFLAAGFMVSAAHAQTSAQTVSASDAIGASNTTALEQGLFVLGSSLVIVQNRLDAGTIANASGVSDSLAAIRGTLGSINGTIALLASRAASVAVNGTPGLPNTGGGGARHIK